MKKIAIALVAVLVGVSPVAAGSSEADKAIDRFWDAYENVPIENTRKMTFDEQVEYRRSKRKATAKMMREFNRAVMEAQKEHDRQMRALGYKRVE